MRLLFLLLACACVAQAAFAQPAKTAAADNPFLQTWKTPFGVPPFDRLKNAHYLPALKEGIARKRAEVRAIADSKKPPTFDNTIAALSDAGALLNKVNAVFSNLSSAETNDELQAVNREVTPLLTALGDDILLDPALFSRVDALYQQRTSLKLNTEQMRLLEKTWRAFANNGAKLDDARKAELRAINQEIAGLSVRFSENLLNAVREYRLVVDTKEELGGLSAEQLEAAATAAKPDNAGKYVFTLSNPSVMPFLTSCDNRTLRERIWRSYVTRCGRGSRYDNTTILSRIASLRAKRASLLGFPTHADLVLQERMLRTPDKVYGLLGELWKPSLEAARREAAELQALARKQGGRFTLQPYDWRFYAEKLRIERYALDENETRQYFALDNVVRGAFEVAKRLYGLTFIERKDIPVYHPEVRAYEVRDADGKHLAVFLADYHPRPGKRGGAWCDEYRPQHFEKGKDVRPVVVNVCNFTRPSGDTPALLTLDEVETLFHEFGHALNSMVARIHYRALGDVTRDFVELPSQIMEHWATHPDVLKLYATHWKTGAPMPDALIAKIRKAGTYGQGFATTEFLASAYVDMDWHTLKDTTLRDCSDFEQQTMGRIGLIPEIVPRHRSQYFQHIWPGGYDAGYYSYLWSAVLDADAFGAFEEKGIFDPATSKSFRVNILEKLGADDPMAMFVRFRGREPQVEYLLKARGLDGAKH